MDKEKKSKWGQEFTVQSYSKFWQYIILFIKTTNNIINSLETFQDFFFKGMITCTVLDKVAYGVHIRNIQIWKHCLSSVIKGFSKQQLFF